MKNTIKFALTATLLASAVNTAMAAGESVDLTVKGTINPVACTPSLSEGGAVDYGIMSSGMLSRNEFTRLEEKRLELTIQCDGQVRLAIKANDSRTRTQAGTSGPGYYAPLTLFGQPDISVFGLGLVIEKAIGGYAIKLENMPVIDGSDAFTIVSSTSGTTWSLANERTALSEPGAWLSWSSTNTDLAAPQFFQNMSVGLAVQAYINKAEQLDLTQPITLDGLANIEIVYL